MFGDGVDYDSIRSEQSGRGNGLQQIAFAALEHSRQYGARRPDVSQQVNIAHPHPSGIRRVDIALNKDSGVRTEQIDVTEAGDGLGHQILDLGFLRNVRM